MAEKGLLVKSVVLLDKPKGMTSFETVKSVSRILGVKKAGHSGTLDKNATGVLLIALEDARKAMPVLVGLDKEYLGMMKLHKDVEKEVLERAMKSFLGEITQVPPLKSAVARKPRKRHVHEIRILKAGGRLVEFRVRCEAGTYVRKLVHDIGKELSSGAHLTELRRTRVGPFGIEECMTLEELEGMPQKKRNGILLPLESVLKRIKLPKIVIKNGFESKIRHGSPVRKRFAKEFVQKAKEGEYCGVYNGRGDIVCIGKLVLKGGTLAKTERVFIYCGIS
jgi:H/ACA ribonucleoprotein complex subunit 4